MMQASRSKFNFQSWSQLPFVVALTLLAAARSKLNFHSDSVPSAALSKLNFYLVSVHPTLGFGSQQWSKLNFHFWFPPRPPRINVAMKSATRDSTTQHCLLGPTLKPGGKGKGDGEVGIKLRKLWSTLFRFAPDKIFFCCGSPPMLRRTVQRKKNLCSVSSARGRMGFSIRRQHPMSVWWMLRRRNQL